MYRLWHSLTDSFSFKHSVWNEFQTKLVEPINSGAIFINFEHIPAYKICRYSSPILKSIEAFQPWSPF